MRLPLGTIWEETAALARREPARLFGLAFLLLALPGAVLQAIVPVAAPGQAPPAGPWLLLLPVVLLASLAGALAISRLALRTDGEASAGLAGALRRLPALLGAALLVGFGIGLLVFGTGFASAYAAASGAPPAVSALLWLAAFVLLLWLWTRLLLLTPAAAAGPFGPAGLIRRSWVLTRGHIAALLGMLAALLVLSLAALFAARAAGGVVIALAVGPLRPGTFALLLSLLLSALIQAAVAGLFTAFVARVYAALAGDS